MKKPVKIVLSFFIFLFLAVAGAGIYFYLDMQKFLNTAANVALNREAGYFYLTVEQGDSFDKVASALLEEGAIADATRFKLYGRYKDVFRQIKAGEFEFRTDWTPVQVLDQLVSGRVLAHMVTIPEGLPWWKVAKILENKGFVKADDFEAVIKDKEFLQRYGIPFDTAEGFLFPETYMLNKSKTPTRNHAESAAITMIRTFWTRTAPLWDEAAQKANIVVPEGTGVQVMASGKPVASFVPEFARRNPEEVKRLVILGSLVEKESAVSDERPVVSGVYTNRIRIGMPLQCDPTIIYGLGPDFSGPIRQSHLRDATNPYNTYKIDGLPPGPIASPGFESMHAAFHPAEHEFIFFVATGKADGRHVFTKTLNEHNIAVQSYRKEVASQRAAQAMAQNGQIPAKEAGDNPAASTQAGVGTASQQGSANINAALPDSNNPDATKPEAANPDVAEPKVADSATALQDTAQELAPASTSQEAAPATTILTDVESASSAVESSSSLQDIPAQAGETPELVQPENGADL